MGIKVGILTFHFAHNYGAQLQAFALCSAINELGYDCEIIDYRLRYIYRWVEKYSFLSYYYNQREDGFSKFRSIARAARYYHKLKQCKSNKWILFDTFMRTYLPLSKRYYSWQMSSLDYDVFVCGSDQIWNLELTGGYSNVYFLDNDNYKRRISYAASTGTDGFDFGEIDRIKSALSRFDRISCREYKLSKTVSKLIGREVPTVCDPVFLLDKKKWGRLFVDIKITEPYLLIYSFSYNDYDDTLMKTAKYLSKKYGLKVKRIAGEYDTRLSPEDNLHDVGPRQFLTLFHNADIILTSTFHGVATSLILNKQFYVIPPESRRERIDYVLNQTELSNRIVEPIITDEIIDYNRVNILIEDMRKKSLSYLSNALKS